MALLFICAGIIAAGIGYFFFGFGNPPFLTPATVTVHDRVFRVEIASTPMLQSKGLSNRASLPADGGMLFAFASSSIRYFWMKDTLIPLDMLWIRADNTIAGIARNVQPEPGKSVFSLSVYASPEPVDKVLEINGGLSDAYGFKTGDTVLVSR